MTIKILTTGGTFDKIYFDANSEFSVGDPVVGELLEEANVGFSYEIECLLKKDSIEINHQDRVMIRARVAEIRNSMVLITHGTDTLDETAQALLGIEDKTIVLFGAMQPARMRCSDAMYNLGAASAAVQILPAGVHLLMNGQVFDPNKVKKNRTVNRFEAS